MEQDREHFAGADLRLVCVARKLRLALRLEKALTAAGIDYVVEADRYSAGFVFRTERVGAFFYVLADVEAAVREIVRRVGLEPYDPPAGTARIATVAPIVLAGCLCALGAVLSSRPVAAIASSTESGRLRVDATRFVREDGSTFAWRGFSDFSLFHRFLVGESIDALLAERAALGANVLRVFGMYGADGIGRANGLGALVPSKQPRYFDRLGAFLDLLAARGMRVEFVVFADAQELLPSAADQQAHLDRVAAVLAPRWNAIGEIVNEPFKNGVEPMRLRAPRGTLWASGEYAWDEGEAASHLDFVTWHPDRATGWPSSAQAQMDLAARVRVPVVADEPLGFAEAAREGERSTSADDAAWFAASAALAGAGATFHSDAGVASRPLGRAQKEAASAWFAGASWVPPGAQIAPRSNDLLPDGARETICKRADGFSWCVAARPEASWQPRPSNGCRVTEQPRRGLVKLACSGGNLIAMLFTRYKPD